MSASRAPTRRAKAASAGATDLTTVEAGPDHSVSPDGTALREPFKERRGAVESGVCLHIWRFLA